MTRRMVPEWLDRMKRELKKINVLKTNVVVFHCHAIMILALKRFSERFEGVCRSPDASIRMKNEEVHKQFSSRL